MQNEAEIVIQAAKRLHPVLTYFIEDLPTSLVDEIEITISREKHIQNSTQIAKELMELFNQNKELRLLFTDEISFSLFRNR